MNAIIHNLQHSAIKPYEEDMAFKAAYLFAPMIIASGDSSSIAFFKQLYPDDAPVKRQLILIEGIPFDQPEWIEYVATIPQLRKQLKRLQEIKHPTKALLVAKKKALDSIKSNYLIVRNQLLDDFPRRAVLLLGNLLTDENYACFDTDLNNPECHSDRYVSLSNIMKIAIDKGHLEEGFLFLLTDNFFISKAAAELKVHEDLESKQEGGPSLISLFRFPDLNRYEKEELQSFRHGLLAQLTPFAEAVDKWTAGIAQQKENRTEQNERVEQVFKSGMAVAQGLKAHSLVQQMAVKEREVELVIGEVPAMTVWQYFKEVNALPDETWKVLSATAEGEKLCPIIGLRYPDRAKFYVEGENEELFIPSEKKSLLID